MTCETLRFDWLSVAVGSRAKTGESFGSLVGPHFIPQLTRISFSLLIHLHLGNVPKQLEYLGWPQPFLVTWEKFSGFGNPPGLHGQLMKPQVLTQKKGCFSRSHFYPAALEGLFGSEGEVTCLWWFQRRDMIRIEAHVPKMDVSQEWRTPVPNHKRNCWLE